jgi:Fe-S-cluster containining protein
MAKIEVYYESSEEDDAGISIRVVDKGASLADLLEAWQPLCDDPGIFKNYATGNYSACKGCQQNCCNTAYVIPDLISFKMMARQLNCSYEEFLRRYFHKEKLDLGLARMKPDPCIFLDNNICSIYPFRSLICRFYICSKISATAQQRIYSISWTGAAATQLFLEKAGLITDAPAGGFSSFDMMFRRLLEEYRNDPNIQLFMNATEYSDIPLEPFLSRI